MKKNAMKLKELSALKKTKPVKSKWKPQHRLSLTKMGSLPKCFIEWPEPAGVATWAENQQPEERKPKVDRSTPTGPPSYAGHHIDT